MEPGTISAIILGSLTGMYALLKGIKRMLGFKKCKCHTNSDDKECVFGCKATKKIRKDQASPEEENVAL